MSRNTKKAVLAIVVLIVLLAAYWGLSKRKPAEPVQQTGNVMIDKKDAVVTKIRMTQTATGTSYVLKKDSNQKWYVEGEEDKAINEPSVDEMIKAATNLKALKIVSQKAENLGQFGLAEGYATAEITYEDNTTSVVNIGNKTTDGNGYYAMMGNTGAVYIISAQYGTVLSYQFSDIRERYTHLVNPEDLSYISLKQEGKEEIVIEPNTVESLTTAYGYGTYVMTKGYREPKTVLSDALTKMIVKPATSIIINQFIEDNVTDISKYGLEEPQAHLYIKDTLGNEIDLSIGQEDGSGNVYIKYADEDSVYTVEKSVIQPILDVTRYYLIDKYVSLENIDDIATVELVAEGVKTVITTERYTDIVGEEKKEVQKTNYFVDGAPVEISDYKDFFAVLIGVNVDAEIGNKPRELMPILTTLITMHDGRSIDLKYYGYDENFYAVERNGVIELIAAKKDIEELITARDTLLSKKK